LARLNFRQILPSERQRLLFPLVNLKFTQIVKYTGKRRPPHLTADEEVLALTIPGSRVRLIYRTNYG
jgi:hypothetical protein